jgi:hypothetical protein
MSIFMNNSMSIRVRKRFIKSYVWNVTLYSYENVILNKAERQILEGSEIWCWRRTLRTSWIEHRTNKSILIEINERREILKTIKDVGT